MSDPLLFAASVTGFVVTLYVIQHLISAYLARIPQDEDARFFAKRNDTR